MKKILKISVLACLAALFSSGLVACSGGGGDETACSHEWQIVQTIEGTCSVEGKTDYKCAKCDATKSESSGFGSHTAEWKYDGTQHWKQYTCEHGGESEKTAHVFNDGVCECGFLTFDKILEKFESIYVFDENTDLVVTFAYSGHYSVSESDEKIYFKDNVVYSSPFYESYGSGESCGGYWLIYDGGYIYEGNHDGDAIFEYARSHTDEQVTEYIKTLPFEWSKHTPEELVSWDSDTQKASVAPLIMGSSLKEMHAIEYEYDGDNVWRGSYESAYESYDMTVTVDSEGRIVKIDCIMGTDNWATLSLEYGNAVIPELPDYENAN